MVCDRTPYHRYGLLCGTSRLKLKRRYSTLDNAAFIPLIKYRHYKSIMADLKLNVQFYGATPHAG
jgi:hypothetical protein